MPELTYSSAGAQLLQRVADESSLRAFTRGYIACALWVGTYDDDGGPDPTSNDLADDARAQLERDARGFYRENVETLTAACEKRNGGYVTADGMEHMGHDFWLTRNRHGAGYWDRGLGELGDTLTAMAHPYGEASLYWGDDGRLYHS